MIYDTIAHIAAYRGISANMDRAIDAILATDFAALPAERFEIDGDNVYFFIQEPDLRSPAQAQFEAHRRYADIQIAISGGEDIGYMPTEQVASWKAYDTEKDIVFSDVEEKGVSLPLNAGSFMILFPQDAHMPCLKNANDGVRKAVFKVKM